MNNVSHRALSKDKLSLAIPIIGSIQRLSCDFRGQILSHHMQLIEASPESLGSGQIADISKSEDIFVLVVSKSLSVHVKQIVGGLGGEASVNEILMRSSWDQRVEIVVWSFIG